MTARADLVDLRVLTQRWRIRRDSEGLPVIPGRRGWVAAHDSKTLCVHVRGRRFLLRLLRALPPAWRRHQIGDDEANLLVSADDLDRACAVVRAYRRRHLTPEAAQALANRLRLARLVPVAGHFGAEIPAIDREPEGRSLRPRVRLP